MKKSDVKKKNGQWQLQNEEWIIEKERPITLTTRGFDLLKKKGKSQFQHEKWIIEEERAITVTAWVNYWRKSNHSYNMKSELLKKKGQSQLQHEE